jgi:hypothetical protein
MNSNNHTTIWFSSNRVRHHHDPYRSSSGNMRYYFRRTLIQQGVMLWINKWPWKLVFLMLFCVALSMLYFRVHERQQLYGNHQYHYPYFGSNHQNRDNNDNHAVMYDVQPEWSWDHNIYNPQQQQQRGGKPPSSSSSAGVAVTAGAQQQQQPRNLLLAQMAGSAALQSMAEITSRPNRAYARQWGRDYVLYKGSAQTLERTCFDKVVVLSTILDKQLLSVSHSTTTTTTTTTDFWSSLAGASGSISTTSTHQKQPVASTRSVQYDVVALFPPDATMTNLDSDLLNLMPPDKLLAIARWELVPDVSSSSSSSTSFATMTQALSSGIVLFNLRHKYASTVVKLWQSMVEPPVSCGACNDLLILLHAVQTVLEQDEQDIIHDGKNHANNNNNVNNNDDSVGGMSNNIIMNAMSSVVATLDETDDGFVGGYSIKTIPLSVPAPKATMLLTNEATSRTELQKTADSVCYRYYPKCEVL